MTALIPRDLLSEADRQRLAPRLVDLLARQTKKYTMGDSTSVTVETAQALLSSLWYTLTVYADETRTPCDRLLTADLWQALQEGQTILRGRVERTKRLWKAVCQSAPALANCYYSDTLRAIGDYFRHYDLYFFADRRPAGIDYPLLLAPSEALHGITYTEHYLAHLLTENRLLRTWDADTVRRILQAVQPDYAQYYAGAAAYKCAGLGAAGRAGTVHQRPAAA